MYRLERQNEVRYTDNKTLAELWVEDGFTIDELHSSEDDVHEDVKEVDLNTLNKALLIDKAQQMGIVIKSNMSKADIINAIEEKANG